MPPPKCATSVKVCFSPPRFVAVTVPPAVMAMDVGSKRHSGTLLCAVSTSSNSVSVMVATVGNCVHVPSPSAPLKVVGSHASKMSTAPFVTGVTTFDSLSLQNVSTNGVTSTSSDPIERFIVHHQAKDSA